MNSSASISLSQLYNFKKLSELQHMTRAAKELYITQPTLSLSIKALEHELGVPLFYREGRQIRPTKHGREFYDKISSVLDELDAGIAAVRSHGAPSGGSLSIGTIPTIQHDFLPALLQQFWEEYGYDVRMGFTVEFSLPLTNALKAQEYDLIFASKADNEPGISYLPMLTKRLVLVVHEQHRFAKRDSVRLSELSDLPFASYRPGTPLGNEMRRLFDAHGIEPSIVYDDEFTLTSVIVSNHQVPGVMLDTFAIERFDHVRKIPLEDVPDDFHIIYLAYDKRIFRSRIVDSFIETALRFSPLARKAAVQAGESALSAS
ncbi:LysR family transcriptional regulator [Gordonibacter sp.]|uniref:LysR family transcriptional regulator n=2 Tax=Gordonibacter sp. TaxID=1968902 RepID=UPI002FC65C96